VALTLICGMAEEFQEIAHSGGKITAHYKPPSFLSLGFEHSAPVGMALFQISVSMDGQKMEFVSIQGIPVFAPQPIIPTWIISDRQQLWGRSCPGCKSYFRTDAIGRDLRCPYCSHKGGIVDFLTANQLQFITNTRVAMLTALREERDVVIDLDKLADKLPKNRPSWVYKEQQQQNLYVCERCKTRYDILGEYGSCPRCGKRNALKVVAQHLDALEKQLADADARLKERQERSAEWEKLLQRAVADFEAFGRDMQKALQEFPATPKRKKEIGNLTFQAIIKTNDNLIEWFGIDFFEGLPAEDWAFLHKMFHRRHLLTHRGGRVDEEYLAKTKDTSVLLHQKIAVHSNEMRRVISLLRGCADRLFAGYESIA
jgi:DNA-directed RNA polymerase subunit RPC12/RpoP